MNKDIINMGIVSKGRLKEESEKIFRKNNLKIYTEDGERGLVAKVKGRKNIRVLFLHAREIIDQLSLGNIDLGISGFDLLMESEINIQKNIKDVREYEIKYLENIGYKVPNLNKKYSINENLMGVTISGSEIDSFKQPTNESYILCAEPKKIWWKLIYVWLFLSPKNIPIEGSSS